MVNHEGLKDGELGSFWRNLPRLFWVALSFLTPFLTPRHEYRSGDIARSSLFFPFIGLFIGVLNYGVFTGLSRFTANTHLPALVTVVVWLVLTRGLHLDGWADICDGLFATRDRDKRRKILKDSHLGTFGAAGLFFLLIWKMMTIDGLSSPWLLILSPVVGRTVAVMIGAFFRPFAREEKGLGEEFLGKVPPWIFGFWMIVMIGFFAWQGKLFLFFATMVVFILSYLFGKMMERSFGGLNGDAIGASIELAESLFLGIGRL